MSRNDENKPVAQRKTEICKVIYRALQKNTVKHKHKNTIYWTRNLLERR